MTIRARFLALFLCMSFALSAVPASAAPRSKAAGKTAARPAARPAAPKTAAKAKSKAPAAFPPADPAITRHEQYPEFLRLLEKQVKENSTSYYDAIDCMLKATQEDETALPLWMAAAAADGNSAAQRWMLAQQLADIPPEKLLAPKIKSAYQNLSKVAETGFVPAIIDQSACLRMGIGTAQDEAASLRKLVEACKSGDFLARFNWLLITKRLSAFEDKDKPEVASEVERGNHYVVYRLSTLAPDSASRYEWLKKAAELNSGEAFFALSSLSSASRPKDSYTLLNEAVRLQYKEAIFVLASALVSEDGSNPYTQQAGISPDPERGRHLLKTASLMGSLSACLVLGNAYYDGALGLPQDYAKAYFHYSNSQIADNAAAATARGFMQLTGKGTPQDTAAGLALLKRAAAAGFPQASTLLAYAYFKGIGVQEDAREASNLLSEAAAYGDRHAYVYLAYVTAKGGPNLPADVPMAKQFVRLAAMDLGERAQKLYESLIVNDNWEPVPHP